VLTIAIVSQLLGIITSPHKLLVNIAIFPKQTKPLESS